MIPVALTEHTHNTLLVALRLVMQNREKNFLRKFGRTNIQGDEASEQKGENLTKSLLKKSKLRQTAFF